MGKAKEKAVHHYSMSKADKLGLAMAKIRGTKANVTSAAVLEGEQNFQNWRKDGYKGAWWQHYFSKNEKD